MSLSDPFENLLSVQMKVRRWPSLAAIVLTTVFVGGQSKAIGSPLCDSLASGTYDILYICPAPWRQEVARLAVHRAEPVGGGYSSIIAPAESISACYGPGRVGIRSMIHTALQNWNSPPRHVVLVGGFGTVDTSVFILPTWYKLDPAIGFWSTTVPTDDPYVFSPASVDSLPAVSVGRIPAWRWEDLSAYIDKVLAYENAMIPTWKLTALHVIEDRDHDGNDGSLARRHADSLAAHFGPLEETNFVRSHLYGTDANTVDENGPVVSAWNAGVGYILFYGTTGSRDKFGFLWSGIDCSSPFVYDCSAFPCQRVDSLQVNNKTPLVFGLTCGCAFARGTTGQPSTCSSLSQYLLFAPSKGTVSITGPARAMHEVPGYAVAKTWYGASFGSGQPSFYREPGILLRDVKQALVPALTSYRTELMQMTVLGDPALQFYVGSDQVVGVGDPDDHSRVPNVLTVRQIGQGASHVEFSVDLPRSGEYRFVLFDVQGREVGREAVVVSQPEYGRQVSVRAASAHTGVYFLRVQGVGLVTTGKALILH
jgi:hypothetical protein